MNENAWPPRQVLIRPQRLLTRRTDVLTGHCGSGALPEVEAGRTASDSCGWPGIFCPLGVSNPP